MYRLLPLICAPAPAFAADLDCDIVEDCRGKSPVEVCLSPGPTKSLLLADYAGETPSIRIAEGQIALRPGFPDGDSDPERMPRTISFVGAAASSARISVSGMISDKFIYVLFEEATSKSQPERSILSRCRITEAGALQ